MSKELKTKVELQPGQALCLVFYEKVKTPFGPQTVKYNYDVSYEDLMQKLGGKRKYTNKSKYNRVISLHARAALTGKWPSGVEVCKASSFSKLINILAALGQDDIAKLSVATCTQLSRLIAEYKYIPIEQKDIINRAICIK